MAAISETDAVYGSGGVTFGVATLAGTGDTSVVGGGDSSRPATVGGGGGMRFPYPYLSHPEKPPQRIGCVAVWQAPAVRLVGLATPRRPRATPRRRERRRPVALPVVAQESAPTRDLDMLRRCDDILLGCGDESVVFVGDPWENLALIEEQLRR